MRAPRAPSPPCALLLQVTLLLRDPYLVKDINEMHCNTRYLKVGGCLGVGVGGCLGVGVGRGCGGWGCGIKGLGAVSPAGPTTQIQHGLLLLPLPLPPSTSLLQDFQLPPNVTATTSAAEAISGAQFAIHAVPVQHTRAFLQGVKV